MLQVSTPYLPNKKKLLKYIDQIYKSKWLTNGPLAEELEFKLAEHLGVKNLVLVTNGTVALNLAYKLLELKGRVLTTPFSYVASTSSLCWDGIEPIFVDINSKSLNLDIDLMKNVKLDENISGILPVHVFGNPCDVDSIQAFATNNNLKVVYDASHAFDVKVHGESILAQGDISTLSFHATKFFHTIEGGALIIKDDNIYEHAKKIKNFGINGLSIDCVGTNAKMHEISAAMGLCVLDEVENILERRKIVFENYWTRLNSVLQLPEYDFKSDLNYSYFPVIFESESKLVEVTRYLLENNISARRYFYPSLNTLNYVKYAECPVAESVSKRVLALPLHPDMDKNISDKVITLILEKL